MKNIHSCDICRSETSVKVPHTKSYGKGEDLDICTNCGFIFAKERRSGEEIAKSWSEEIFGAAFTDKTYTARVPAVRARQTYVADTVDAKINLKGKSVCDIGAGEGQFLQIVKDQYLAGEVFGVEPSEANCKLMAGFGFESFSGTIESFKKAAQFSAKKYDVVTLMWTLVNTTNCREMMDIAFDLVKPGGHIVLAEGSRILVPFKKPLQLYIANIHVDCHPYHFSANSLSNLLKVSGFELAYLNRFIDSDVLCVIGRKPMDGKKANQPIDKDDYLKVYNFFERWHADSQVYYSEYRQENL